MWVFEWTGEEFLPAIKDASLVYQHIHRYLYAAELVKGKRVLDLSAGDGFGATILAEAASSVTAVVADDRLAARAAEKYKKSNVQFVTGFAADAGFDAVIHFHDSLPVDVKRFMKSDGLLILSASCGKDFTCEELRERVAGHFSNVRVLGQGVYASSSIWPIEPPQQGTSREVVVSRSGTDPLHRVSGEQRRPSCLIAVASDSAGAVQGLGSVLVDEANELLQDKERTIQELNDAKLYQAKALQGLEAQLAERRESLASLQEAFAWHKSQIESLTKTRDFFESELNHYKNTVASNEQGLAWRASQVESLERTIVELNEDLTWHVAKVQELGHEVERLQVLARELDVIKNSTGWKFVLRVRSTRARMFPFGTVRYRVYQGVMSLLRRLR
jgi:SAM-dependent methyltransferase